MKFTPGRGWRRRIVLAALGVAAAGTALWMRWSPGLDVRDGRHDLGTNGMWLQHGWLASDEWFARNGGASRAECSASRRRSRRSPTCFVPST